LLHREHAAGRSETAAHGRRISTSADKSLAVASIARDVGSCSTNRSSDIMH